MKFGFGEYQEEIESVNHRREVKKLLEQGMSKGVKLNYPRLSLKNCTFPLVIITHNLSRTTPHPDHSELILIVKKRPKYSLGWQYHSVNKTYLKSIEVLIK